MEGLGLEMSFPDTKRSKRGKKLSLSLSAKEVDIQKGVDTHGMKRSEGGNIVSAKPRCEGSASPPPSDCPVPKLPSPAKTIFSSQAPSPVKKSSFLKPLSPMKSCSQQKQVGALKRGRVKNIDKKTTPGITTVPGSDRQSKPVIPEDFFMPVSKKRKLQKEARIEEEANIPISVHGTKRSIEQVSSRDTKDAVTETTKHPAKTEARVVKRSPKKKKSLASSSSLLSQVPIILTLENDLRVKAELDAKDNAEINAGRGIFPMFLKQKASTSKSGCFSNSANYLEACAPGHVTQCAEEKKTVAMFEDPIEFSPLEIERCKEGDLVHRLKNSGYTLQDYVLLSGVRCPDQNTTTKFSRTLATSYLSKATVPAAENCGDCLNKSRSQQSFEDILEFFQNVKPRRKFTGAYVEPSDGLPGVSSDISLATLKERFAWYKTRHDTFVSDKISGCQNLLWADLYQPRSAKEICGNSTAVEVLNNWLQNWREKMMGEVKDLDLSRRNAPARHHEPNSDKGWFEDDSDMESDEETDLYNTLLITGPTGCGKSAAIYACAAEQGLTVIEVNASSCRTGAFLTQKFGKGAMECHAMAKRPTPDDQTSATEQADEGQKKPERVEKLSPQILGKARRKCKDLKDLAGRSVDGRRLSDSCGSNGTEKNLGVSVEDFQTANLKKTMTVILFEDVDIHFEEDRGFLNALVQIAKRTRRPIILTSNCRSHAREPGLPQILERSKIEFCPPTPEELVLHASMVCIAEGVASTPWIVNRLVESCQCDLRKVMMALQFWRQGSSRQMSGLESSRPEGACDHQRSVSTERLPKKSLNLRPTHILSTEASTDAEQTSSPAVFAPKLFRQWDSDARYLFELDIHHIILPDVFTTNYPCLLSMDVAKKINVAVGELHKHETMVATRDAERQGLALQVQIDVAEAARKALKREKDAIRRASRAKGADVEEDGTVEAQSPQRNPRLTGSPVKNVRQALALARTPSPLKARINKPKRALLLYDSDNEKVQHSHVEVEDLHDHFAPVSTPESGGIHMTEAQDSSSGQAPANVVLSDDLEDKEVMYSPSCGSTATVRRKRLHQDSRKDSLCSIAQTHSNADFNSGVASEDVTTANIRCSDTVKYELSASQNPPTSPSSETISHEKPTSHGCHSGTGSTQRDANHHEDSEQILKHFVDLESDNSGAVQTGTKTGNAESSKQQILGFDLNLPPENNESSVYTVVNSVNLCTSNKENDRGDVNGIVDLDNSRYPTSEQQYSSGIFTTVVRNVTIAEKQGSLEMETLTSFPTDPQGKFPEDVGVGESAFVYMEDAAGFVDPVQVAWRTLRDHRQTLGDLLGPVHPSINISTALANVLDFISVSDELSSFSTEDWKDAWIDYRDSWSGLFEGNIGHCSHWELAQDIASHLVRAGLQQFSTSLLVSPNCADNTLPVISGILSAANDVPAVGKCMVKCDDMRKISTLTEQLKIADDTHSSARIKRHSARQERLKEIIESRLLSRGRVSEARLQDYVAYLARISQHEELRRTHSTSESRRPRRFQHHLSSRLSETDIAEVLLLSKFGN